MTFCEQYYALYVCCADNQERILAVFLLIFLYQRCEQCGVLIPELNCL